MWKKVYVLNFVLNFVRERIRFLSFWTIVLREFLKNIFFKRVCLTSWISRKEEGRTIVSGKLRSSNPGDGPAVKIIFPAAETKPSIIFSRFEAFLTVHLHKYEVKGCRLERPAYRCRLTKFKTLPLPSTATRFLSLFSPMKLKKWRFSSLENFSKQPCFLQSRNTTKHERRKTPGRESSRYASHRIKTHARFPRREFLATRILPRIKSVFRLSESFADFRGSIVATTSGDTLTEIGSGLERFKSWSWRRKRASCPAGNFYQAFHVQQWTILSVSRIESSLVSLVSRIGNDNYSLTFIPFLLRISRERENTLRRLNTRHWI